MTKFCMSVDIQDVITCATFCDDRLRGLGMARGRISRFPIDLRRHSYNTLALPCESVVMGFDVFLTAAGEKALNRSSFIVELCQYLIL